LAQCDPNVALVKAWAEVLETSEDDVWLKLAAIAPLVPAIQTAAEAMGDEPFIQMVNRYRSAWAMPIFPRNQAFSAPLNSVRPKDVHLEALAAVSTYLHRSQPEGLVPSAGEIDDLQEQLRNLAADVEVATDLPGDIKHLILARLFGVQEAIRHVAVGGPEAVRFATEALLGSVAVRDLNSTNSATFRRVMTVPGVIWVAFTAGPTIQNSLDAWDSLATGALTSGSSSHAETVTPTDVEHPPHKESAGDR
jgi:hypothetical protein